MGSLFPDIGKGYDICIGIMAQVLLVHLKQKLICTKDIVEVAKSFSFLFK